MVELIASQWKSDEFGRMAKPDYRFMKMLTLRQLSAYCARVTSPPRTYPSVTSEPTFISVLCSSHFPSHVNINRSMKSSPSAETDATLSKGHPSPSATSPSQPTRPASTTTFHPPADTSTYRDLLLFEERLKMNAEMLRRRRRRYSGEASLHLFGWCKRSGGA